MKFVTAQALPPYIIALLLDVTFDMDEITKTRIQVTMVHTTSISVMNSSYPSLKFWYPEGITPILGH